MRILRLYPFLAHPKRLFRCRFACSSRGWGGSSDWPKRIESIHLLTPDGMTAKTRDYFAEMYVAGVLADAGWNVYFPRRDQGFDFIITKAVGGTILVRPVQVKGKYPQVAKTDKSVFGYSGRLTQLHPEMVLAMPFLSQDSTNGPKFTAYIPRGQIRQRKNDPELYFCFPAYFERGQPEMRRDFQKFFGAAGIALLESQSWPDEQPEAPVSADDPLP